MQMACLNIKMNCKIYSMKKKIHIALITEIHFTKNLNFKIFDYLLFKSTILAVLLMQVLQYWFLPTHNTMNFLVSKNHIFKQQLFQYI